LLSARIKEVERKVLPVNHRRAVDAARLVDMAFMGVHTPADNCVATYLQKLMDRRKPQTVGDVIKILREIPEYKEAAKENAGPKLLRGSPERRAGKIFVEMTGGTEGPKDVFSRLATAGVGTIVCMHLSEDHLKKVEDEHISVIVAGHISSDNLGLNLLFDELLRKERIEIIACSGFKRIAHNKK
jgi:putative NIF3 family GTP cyclohydrolase 1 type 2